MNNSLIISTDYFVFSLGSAEQLGPMCFLGWRVLEVTVIQEHVSIRETEKHSKLTVGAHKDSRCLLKRQRQGALVGIKRKSLPYQHLRFSS